MTRHPPRSRGGSRSAAPVSRVGASVVHPVLPAGSHRLAVGAIAVTLLPLVGLGIRYAGESSARWMDSTVSVLVREWLPLSPGAGSAVIGLADPVPAAVQIAVLAAVSMAFRRWRLAVLVVAGPVLTGFATTVGKSVVGRTKNGELAFPSGHMGVAIAIVIVALLLVVSLGRVRPGVATAVVAGGTLLVAVGMALAMTAREYHYPTDAVGGFCAAVVVVLGLALLLDRLPARHAGRS
jgi:PAP2 superfamily